jgi:hypothetical protein
MKRIDPLDALTLRSEPNAVLRCIVRTKGPPGVHMAALETRGLRVVYVSALINAVTVEGRASVILNLVEEEWVTGIELDKPVHTM